jgi:hypothetical protein
MVERGRSSQVYVVWRCHGRLEEEQRECSSSEENEEVNVEKLSYVTTLL